MVSLGLKLRRGNARVICLTSRSRPIGRTPRKPVFDYHSTISLIAGFESQASHAPRVKAILRALYLGENWRIRPEQGRLRPVLYGGKKTGYTYLQPWIKGRKTSLSGIRPDPEPAGRQGHKKGGGGPMPPPPIARF